MSETEPGPWAGPHFTAIVKLALKRELATFEGSTLVGVRVVTATPLRLSKGEIRDIIRLSGVHAPAARILVEVDPSTVEPGFHIHLEAQPAPPRPRVGPDATRAEHPLWTVGTVGPSMTLLDSGDPPAYEEPTVPPSDFFPTAATVVLALCFGSWRWTYPLVTSDTWIPLGRGLVSGGRRSTVRVPEFMSAIPRGTLLLIRHTDDATHLRRSAMRTEYVVSVDGRPLATGAQATLARSGAVEYGTTFMPERSTTLLYELT